MRRAPSKNAACKCGALPGEPCVTAGGRPRNAMHVLRVPADPMVNEYVLVKNRNGTQVAHVIELGNSMMRVSTWEDTPRRWSGEHRMPKSRFVDRPLPTDPRLKRAMEAQHAHG